MGNWHNCVGIYGQEHCKSGAANRQAMSGIDGHVPKVRCDCWSSCNQRVSYTLTPSFATRAASTYLRGIGLSEAELGKLHPPASCSRSSGVPFRALRVAQACRRSCAPWHAAPDLLPPLPHIHAATCAHLLPLP